MSDPDPEEVDPEDVYFRCPNGHLGRIDADQLAGEVSIVCEAEHYGECGFHGYVDDGELVRRDAAANGGGGDDAAE